MNPLELRGVWFGYGADPVLRGVEFVVGKGQSVALLGQNGAGKTTLTRLTVGLRHPQRGDVIVGGIDTAGLRPEDLATRIAYVFQHSDQQLFERTVRREVSFAPRQLGRGEAGVRQATDAALGLLRLESLADEHPYDLPPATRKLVALAAALAQEPVLLVLDEPTQGLDRPGKQRVLEALREFTADGGAVLAVTHDMWFSAEACARALVLADGRITADESTSRLLADEERLRQLGLRPPPAAAIAARLGLEGSPVKEDDVVRGMKQRIR